MAHFYNALICAAVATLFWGGLGLSLAHWLRLPTGLRLPLAPALGWAVHSSVVLPLFLLTGMTGLTVSIAALLAAIAACGVYARRSRFTDEDAGQARVPIWAIFGAVVFACSISSIIIPRFSADGAALAPQVFDHAKIAIIDDIARLGVPAGNPFFAETGGLDRLSYYYLWHFSAAEIVVLTGLSGWEADAGMTGFTALCSLSLMMGFAVWLSGRPCAAGWALLMAATASMRPAVAALFGMDNAADIIGYPTGLGAWQFQIGWAPQHVASANTVVVAIFLLVQLARRQTGALAVAAGSAAAAAFGSSTWVGGVTFPLAAIAMTPIFILQTDARRRGRLLLLLVVAGLIAVGLTTPFLIDQLKASVSRGDGFPIALTPFDALGDELSPTAHLLLKIPVYWTIFLFVEFAAFYPAGFLFAIRLARDRLLTAERRETSAMFALLAIVGLAVGGLLMSTVAPNNDLSWRGVLPSVLTLGVLTAAGLGRYLRTLRPVTMALLALPTSLALSTGLTDFYDNMIVTPSASAQRFVKSAAMWAAVRRHTGIAERVSNNPQFLSDMTNWPINISWALLANRRSCYAASDLALPFAPLTKQRREDVNALFTRVFAGMPEAGDVLQLRDRYNCDVVVLTPDDGAWTTDALAKNDVYRLVETDPTGWRIYRRTTAPP